MPDQSHNLGSVALAFVILTEHYFREINRIWLPPPLFDHDRSQAGRVSFDDALLAAAGWLLPDSLEEEENEDVVGNWCSCLES